MYEKYRATRNALRYELLLMALFVCLFGAGSFIPGTLDWLIGKPDRSAYQTAFAKALAAQYHQATAIPTVVETVEKSALEEGQTAMDTFQTLKKRFPDTKNTIRQRPGITYILLVNGTNSLLVIHDAMAKPLSTNSYVRLDPDRVLATYGQYPKLRMQSVDALLVNLDEVKLARLYWGSSQDPDLEAAERQLQTLITMPDNLGFNNPATISALRREIGWQFYTLRLEARLLFGLALLFLAWVGIQLWRTHRKFLSALSYELAYKMAARRGQVTPYPSFAAFLTTRSLLALRQKAAGKLIAEIQRETRSKACPAGLSIEGSGTSTRLTVLQQCERASQLILSTCPLEKLPPEVGSLYLQGFALMETRPAKALYVLNSALELGNALRNSNGNSAAMVAETGKIAPAQPGGKPNGRQQTPAPTNRKDMIDQLLPLTVIGLLVTGDISAITVREVIWNLSKRGLFGKVYTDGDWLGKHVASSTYHRYGFYNGKDLTQALRWMVRQQVILDHNKQQPTYSLSTKATSDKPENVQQLIRMAIACGSAGSTQPRRLSLSQ